MIWWRNHPRQFFVSILVQVSGVLTPPILPFFVWLSWLPLQQYKHVPCYTVITSPAGAKYCDKHVCLYVCLFVIFGTTRAIFTKFCACFLRPWTCPPAGLRNPEGMGNFGVFSSHWQCIVTRSLQITSCSNRTDHSVAAGGDGVHRAGEVWSTIALLNIVITRY